MNTLQSKPLLDTPFRIEVVNVDNEPDKWASAKVSIYRNNNLIGEYLRNYCNYTALTFCPFKIGGDWYALYSANYTSTRVMKLHDDHIEDWCGEDAAPGGFCPTEISVPKYVTVIDPTSGEQCVYTDFDYSPEELTSLRDDFQNHTVLDIQWCSFGFLCGCEWGDNSSWKLMYIDLSKVPNKILSITPKFGYWELPHTLELRKCIDMNSWEPDDQLVLLTKAEWIRL